LLEIERDATLPKSQRRDEQSWRNEMTIRVQWDKTDVAILKTGGRELAALDYQHLSLVLGKLAGFADETVASVASLPVEEVRPNEVQRAASVLASFFSKASVAGATK
jgi:hypothetical protein